MAEETKNTGATGGSAPAPTVATPIPGSAPGNIPPLASVKASVAQAGGNPTGRESKFKFPAGTPEGDKERREADAERKRKAREAAAKLAEPPPLPSAGTNVPGEQSPASGPVDPDQPGETSAPAVPWTPELVSGLLDELIEAAEQGRVASYVGKCQEAGLMPKLIKEIEKDAHWPKSAKLLLKESLPRLAAKWLNKTGISAEYRDEVAVVTALILILKHDRKTDARFAEFLEAVRAEKKPDAQNTSGVKV